MVVNPVGLEIIRGSLRSTIQEMELLMERCAMSPFIKEKKDFFVDYCAQGKKAYHIASTIKTDREQDTPDEVLQQLSNRFEMCAFGLGEVRREWERRDDGEMRILLTE